MSDFKILAVNMVKVNKNNKIIVILGTTASGKTGLGVWLAAKFNGEIISADSRQVYRGMDIGTGKDLKDYKIKKGKEAKIIKIPYHLIDVVSPRTEFNLGKWLKRARAAVDDILTRGKIPIVAGGTGLYAQALVDDFNLSPIKADKSLRARLEKLSVKALFVKLRKLDHKFADDLHESDKRNKRRLIRYIEIRQGQKKVKPLRFTANSSGLVSLIIGLTWPREELRRRIYKRLIKRLEKEGMVEEVKRLHAQGVSWRRLEDFGLEYKYISLYLRGKLDYGDMVERLYRAICQFARRQRSWLRRWERSSKIYWVKDKKEAVRLVKTFIHKNI